jgi:hypothetical protein
VLEVGAREAPGGCQRRPAAARSALSAFMNGFKDVDGPGGISTGGSGKVGHRPDSYEDPAAVGGNPKRPGNGLIAFVNGPNNIDDPRQFRLHGRAKPDIGRAVMDTGLRHGIDRTLGTYITHQPNTERA